jgi:hypothetical protein
VTPPLGEPPWGGHIAGPLGVVAGTIWNIDVGLTDRHVEPVPQRVTFGQEVYRLKVDEHVYVPEPHVQGVQPRLSV